MSPRPRSSTSIRLVLAGSVAIAGCGDEQPMQRNVYASYEDCKADWGDPKRCEPTDGARSGGSGSGGGSGGMRYWYGPEHAVNPKQVGKPSGRALSAQVTRGGFGASSGFHGSGS